MLPAMDDRTKLAMTHNERPAPSVDSYSSGTTTPAGINGTKPVPSSAAGMQTVPAVEAAILAAAKIRANRPVDQTFFLAVMAGIWVGFGGIAGLNAAGGIPNSVRADWPIIPKFLTGFFFAFALHFIVIMGGELVTGTTMVFSIGWYNRAIPIRRSLINLVVVYIGNWCGCLIMAYFMAYLSDLFVDASSKQWMNSLVLGKVGHGWGVLFLRAIGANTMVCVAIAMFNACTDSAGKIMILWIPVVTFVVSGFEHCVANMFFLSTGLLYGAPSTVGKLWFNQSAAICGNFIGGAVVVGLSMHLINSWKSHVPWPEASKSLPSTRLDEERMGVARSS
ncbi:putative transporter YrhG OS=Bacillus subtilis (strain 168) GN=yrhG PE=3 SV=1 [Rhizoctonia solani AG-1 IB]|uniref:Putative transporter YrhG n=1 Tax=Thanatephorus cucumeris (strain AG1-IB / isolate 7/3/14) TaxID=1108050 RepID=A0A0B7FG62_THACB|nr:putative transporter YrhG OS=Bacillus subtilis (strain 168) GN=yrhG PE=3 SV=1 [Rhizoctonia solani AG-1 IB]